MAFNSIIILPIRIAQAIFSLIVLSVLAYAAHFWHGTSWTPAPISFLVFASVWTLLVLIYLVVAPLRFKQYSHKYAILAVETVTMIFWFAGFVALADWLGAWGWWGRSGPWSAAVAGCVFGAFLWLLFCFTTFMAAHHVWSTRGEHSGKHDPNIEVQHV